MPEARIYVIGVTPDGMAGLSPEARRRVEQAEIIYGGKRLLAMFKETAAQKIVIGGNLAEIADRISNIPEAKPVIVLASGDPNFYGIASYLINKLGKDNIEIIPNVSSMQTAFAKIRESWQDAVFVSAHGRSTDSVIKAARTAEKIGIFTDDVNTPAAIARDLLQHGIDNRTAYVCQDLGAENEKIVETDIRSLQNMVFSPLNVLIIIKNSGTPATNFATTAIGIPDAEFFQRRPKAGLITKQEIRAVSLARMRIAEDSVVWDIGAGSGAVSVEASFLARQGAVYAVEKNSSDIAIINKNIQKFNAGNVEVIRALAPAGLEDLPDPDTVFIGGSSGKMKDIITTVSRRLKPAGRLVINIISLENLNSALDILKSTGFTPETTLVNISRATVILDLTRLEALNPVFIVSADIRDKKGEGE